MGSTELNEAANGVYHCIKLKKTPFSQTKSTPAALLLLIQSKILTSKEHIFTQINQQTHCKIENSETLSNLKLEKKVTPLIPEQE